MSDGAPRTHVALTRRVAFAAAHRYRRADWSEARNREVFGACANPNFHGHSYTCDVTITGPVSAETGMLIDLARLDGVLASEVRQRFDHRNINTDIPEFADGGLIPTSENLARFILERVQAALGTAVRVASVTVAEDATLSATCTVA